MNVEELASGYLSFTGRPAATLSVSEYLEFVKVASSVSNIGTPITIAPICSDTVPNIVVNESKEALRSATTENLAEEKSIVPRASQEKTVQEDVSISAPVAPSVIKTYEAPKADQELELAVRRNNQTSPEDKKAKALALLKSVNG